MMTVIELVRQTHLYVNAQMKETVEHFLLRCPRYNQFRSTLISTIQEIGTSSKSKSHLYNIYITESVNCTLLGHEVKQEGG